MELTFSYWVAAESEISLTDESPLPLSIAVSEPHVPLSASIKLYAPYTARCSWKIYSAVTVRTNAQQSILRAMRLTGLSLSYPTFINPATQLVGGIMTT